MRLSFLLNIHVYSIEIFKQYSTRAVFLPLCQMQTMKCLYISVFWSRTASLSVQCIFFQLQTLCVWYLVTGKISTFSRLNLSFSDITVMMLEERSGCGGQPYHEIELEVQDVLTDACVTQTRTATEATRKPSQNKQNGDEESIETIAWNVLIWRLCRRKWLMKWHQRIDEWYKFTNAWIFDLAQELKIHVDLKIV